MITSRNGLCIIGREVFRNVASINVGTVQLHVAVGGNEAIRHSMYYAGLLAECVKREISLERCNRN
jgi:hypothetical protein